MKGVLTLVSSVVISIILGGSVKAQVGGEPDLRTYTVHSKAIGDSVLLVSVDFMFSYILEKDGKILSTGIKYWVGYVRDDKVFRSFDGRVEIDGKAEKVLVMSSDNSIASIAGGINPTTGIKNSKVPDGRINFLKVGKVLITLSCAGESIEIPVESFRVPFGGQSVNELLDKYGKPDVRESFSSSQRYGVERRHKDGEYWRFNDEFHYLTLVLVDGKVVDVGVWPATLSIISTNGWAMPTFRQKEDSSGKGRNWEYILFKHCHSLPMNFSLDFIKGTRYRYITTYGSGSKKRVLVNSPWSEACLSVKFSDLPPVSKKAVKAFSKWEKNPR